MPPLSIRYPIIGIPLTLIHPIPILPTGISIIEPFPEPIKFPPIQGTGSIPFPPAHMPMVFPNRPGLPPIFPRDPRVPLNPLRKKTLRLL